MHALAEKCGKMREAAAWVVSEIVESVTPQHVLNLLRRPEPYQHLRVKDGCQAALLALAPLSWLRRRPPLGLGAPHGLCRWTEGP